MKADKAAIRVTFSYQHNMLRSEARNQHHRSPLRSLAPSSPAWVYCRARSKVATRSQMPEEATRRFAHMGKTVSNILLPDDMQSQQARGDLSIAEPNRTADLAHRCTCTLPLLVAASEQLAFCITASKRTLPRQTCYRMDEMPRTPSFSCHSSHQIRSWASCTPGLERSKDETNGVHEQCGDLEAKNPQACSSATTTMLRYWACRMCLNCVPDTVLLRLPFAYVNFFSRI
nr:hypothetical protein CFP56_07482 [Quercus suber]